MNRDLTPTERRLAKSLLLVSLVAGLTWVWLFFSSGDWVRTDDGVVLALLLLVGGLMWLAFAFIAALVLLFGVRQR